MRKFYINLLVILSAGLMLTASTACDKNGKINLLSVEDDKKLGAQTADQIAADPATYPVIPRNASSQAAYTYLDGIRDRILQSGKLTYKDDFTWEMHLIDDDSTLNAFCTPGGYIYVYSGLIKYLDRVDDLAGVLGHEMGHADLRHTSREITRQQGYDLVLSVALGQNPGALAQIANQLITLQYSQGYETEADEASVKYLGGTDYACNGAASFFEKLIALKQTSNVPAFLSTHPAEEKRVADINETADKQGCDKTAITESGMSYAQFKTSLP